MASGVQNSTDAAKLAVKQQGPYVGQGLIWPFKRDKKSDFASKTGVELIRANVALVLGTVASSTFTQGELPWRPEFGSLLNQLRHLPNDQRLRALARVYVVDAITRWVPSVRITDVEIVSKDAPNAVQSVLQINVRYNIVSTASRSPELVAPNLSQIVTVG